MIKIAHISDTHIRNLKFHKEYREIFSRIYNILSEQKVDYIVHCGDIAHTKTQLSPEFFELATDFLKNLANIAPTYVLLGNHDGNLKNGGRQDAITPIVQALQHSNLLLLKDSGEYQVNDKLTFNVLSIFDEDNWAKISNPEKINVALYHGSVSGVQTDIGFVMEHGDHDISIFEGFDYCFLGDIHKTNQALDTEGRVRYPGSTVQQNFGETNDKGFLIWNIEDKDTFSVEHVSIPHPSPFITIELTSDGNLPENLNIQEGARLRLVSNNHISLQALKKSVDIAKTRFKPDSVTVQNKPGKRISIEELTNQVEHENLRDIPTQEKLISEYLKDYKLDETTLNKVFEFNRKYNTLAEQTDDIARNVHWKLKNIEWNNLFNYGKDNNIDFTNINGVLGIFGKNYSGKSSVIDSILWTLFNSISKNVRKNVDIINQNCDEATGKVEIQIDNKTYQISRESKKYTKKLYGEQTVEAKTSLDFSVIDNITGITESLNGLDRNETDANIRRVFGSIDDFLLTSMTSQVGSLAFINEGSTKRKEILGKFLDLELFDKKFKLAKDESALLKGAIKRLEGKDFDVEISKTLTEMIDNEILTECNKQKCSVLRQELSVHQNELSDLNAKIRSGPKQEFIDIDKVLNDVSVKQQEENDLNIKTSHFLKELEKRDSVLIELNETLSKYDYQKLKQDKKALEELNKKALLLESAVQMLQKQKKEQQKQISILDNVPCGDSFLSCRFLVDAAKQRQQIPETEKKLLENETLLQEVEDKIKKDETQKHINKFEQLNNNLHLIDKEASDFRLKIEKNKGQIVACQKVISDLRVLEKTYHENEAWMKQLQDIKQTQKEINKQVILAQDTLEACESDTNKLYREHGSLVNKKETLEREKLELANLRDEFLAYDLFIKSMHSNGIVYDIIKKRLPVINQEIAKVLSNIVNFEVFFEDDGKKLDIYIRHPKYDPRPIELGSGAEKSIAAIAIRLALIKVSNLPVGDIFVLDEPATALDEENMEGFVRIIDMVKTQFKAVILISHLEALKDIVDEQIIIESVNGFAKVNI